MRARESRIRPVFYRTSNAKLLSICLIVIVFSHFENTPAAGGDHIGPDPIQSENCLIITPGHSIVCRGSATDHKSVSKPTLTINCGPGLFVLIRHHEVEAGASVREMKLETADGKLTRQWLAPSAIQSAVLLFHHGSGDFEYAAMFRLIGSLLRPEVSELRFSVGGLTVTGAFAFTYSDRKLLEQVAPSCG